MLIKSAICFIYIYRKNRVVQNMSIGLSTQQNNIDDDHNRFIFYVFVGNLGAFLLKIYFILLITKVNVKRLFTHTQWMILSTDALYCLYSASTGLPQ